MGDMLVWNSLTTLGTEIIYAVRISQCTGEYWGHLEQIQANGVGTPVHPLVDHHFHLDIVGFGGCAKKKSSTPDYHIKLVTYMYMRIYLCIYLYIHIHIYIYTVYEKFQDRGNDFVYSQYVYIFIYIYID